MSGKYNLSIKQYSTLDRKLYWVDKFKNPLSLDGFTPKMSIRKDKEDGELLFDFSQYMTVENNYIHLLVPSEITKLFTTELRRFQLFYDIVIIKDSYVKTLVGGNIVVLNGVTIP
jgi:hypothetical protein